MTNIELIEKLQTTVEEYGVLPVYIDAGILREDEEIDNSVRDAVCHDDYVTLYNY